MAAVEYITTQDLNLEGAGIFGQDMEARATRRIQYWSATVDRICRQWFESRAVDLLVDGTGTATLWLPFPIITCTALYVNDVFTTALDSTYYKVYNRNNGAVDDRRNPKITLHPSGSDLYARLLSRGIFTRGDQNQKISGTFGFVDLDGNTPAEIKRAVTKLVMKDLAPLGGATGTEPSPPGPAPLGGIVGITVDRNTYRFTAPAMSRVPSGTMMWTGDAEVDSILAAHRGPILLGVSGRPQPGMGG